MIRRAVLLLALGWLHQEAHAWLYRASWIAEAQRGHVWNITGAINGDRFRIVRTGLGAFTLDVGGLKTIPSATAAWADVEFTGSAWVLTGYGTL